MWSSDPRSLLRPPGPEAGDIKRAVLSDLASASDADLLAAHRLVLEEACTTDGGPHCYVVHRVLARLALEVLDRGLQTVHMTRGLRDHYRGVRKAWLN